jgi:hypothetical protein
MLRVSLQVASGHVIRDWRQGSCLATSDDYKNNNLTSSMESVYKPLRTHSEIIEKFYRTYGRPICNVDYEVRHFAALLHEYKTAKSFSFLPENVHNIQASFIK